MIWVVCYYYTSVLSMEDTTQQINTPLTSSGRLSKTEGRSRSFSEERIRFIEEEYDVKCIDL